MTENELKISIISSLRDVVTDINFDKDINSFISNGGLKLPHSKKQCLMYIGIKKAKE